MKEQQQLDRLGEEISRRVSVSRGYLCRVEVLTPSSLDPKDFARQLELHLAELGMDAVEVACTTSAEVPGARLERTAFEDRWSE